MNKYLQTYNRMREIAQKELNTYEYEAITKCLISNELDYLLGWNDYITLKLNDTEQEKLINIIYDFYSSLEETPTVFKVTKAVLDSVIAFDSFTDFEKEYNTNCIDLESDFSWRL